MDGNDSNNLIKKRCLYFKYSDLKDFVASSFRENQVLIIFSGIKYYQEKLSKRCIMQPLNNETLDVGVSGNGGFSLFMKDPMQLFRLNNSYAYTGQVRTDYCNHSKLSPVMRKPVLPYANNKGADQPAHLRSLINAFVVRFLDSMIISLVSISKTSRL